MDEKTAKYVANIIKKCYSPRLLEQAAAEMGEQVMPGEDIFRALMRAGRALDLETAVTLVARHLEEETLNFDEVPMFLRSDRGSDPSHH